MRLFLASKKMEVGEFLSDRPCGVFTGGKNSRHLILRLPLGPL